MFQKKTQLVHKPMTAALTRLNVAMTFTLLLIVGATGAVYVTQAAMVSAMRDVMTNQAASGTSSHAISFALSGGNTFVSGEHVAIDFSETSAFTQGGTWAVADFMFNDGTARTVDAVNAGAGVTTSACTNGANNVGIAVDTIALAFRVIPCGGLFVPSSAGATVTFSINGAAADGTLTNPSISGTYAIFITNAAGDCTGVNTCAVGVAIVSSSSVSVTAAVVIVCGNSLVESGETCDDGNVVSGDGCSSSCLTEGGGGPPPDATPPVISSIAVTGITGSGATVTWTTNEGASSSIDHGTTVSYGSNSSQGALVVSHSRIIIGLAVGTTYHYRVCSADGSSNQVCSADATFTTADTLPPSISSVVVSGITASGATIIWTTNEAATQFVDYDTAAGPSYGSVAGNATPLGTTHTVVLTGLTANTTYHYRVRSGDAASNEAFTADAMFVTLDGSAPTITSVAITAITASSATVTWITNEAATQFVDYDTAAGPPYGSVAGNATPLGTTHTVVLTGLTEATTYHYSARSADATSNVASTADAMFMTLDATAPIITSVTASLITPTTARITWMTDEAADSAVDHGATIAYGTTATDIAIATSHQVDLTSLAPNTTHHYRVHSSDAASNEAVSVDFTFTTPLPLPPAISAVSVSNITQTSARISWTTDSASSSVVEYGTTVAYGSTVSNATPATGHLVVLNGLTKGATYHFHARSTDAFAQESASLDAVFSTLPDAVAPANVTVFAAIAGDGQVQLSWTNPVDADFDGTRIVRKTSGFPTGPIDGTLIYDGLATSPLDVGLLNASTYYYAAFAHDDVPNYASGAIASATPTALIDLVPPTSATGLTAIAGDAQVQLSWMNPYTGDWAGTRVVRKEGSNPVDQNDGTVVYDGIGDNRLDTFVTNGVIYHYGSFAYDTSSNYASASYASAMPTEGAPTPPAPACSDSDGGLNFDTQGTVTLSGGQTYGDTCADFDTVTEHYCGAGADSVQTHDCGTGSRCSGGRCVPDDYVPGEICGNGICAGGENGASCAIDCPIEPQTPPVMAEVPTVTDEEHLTVDNLRFHTTTAKIPLSTVAESMDVLVGLTFTVKIPDESIRKPILRAFVNFAGASYVMRQTASYEATVTTPSSAGNYPLSIVVDYVDATSDSLSMQISSLPRGTVYETVNGQDVSVPGARVTLFSDVGGGNYGIWNGAPSGQSNPQTTDANGKYGFIIPRGSYSLWVEKEGYALKETLPFPAANVVVQSVRIVRLPPKITDVASAVKNANFVAKIAAEEVKEVINNPYIEESTRNIAAPTAVVAAVANVASAGAATATAVPYLLYVYSFLAHPTLLLGRRRRKQWGIVYNAYTKLPVDLAIVRLKDANTGRIVRSAVTDKDGRYFFIVAPGQYQLTVVKAGYIFPTTALKGAREDGRFLDLYHGEPVVATEGATITANIPLDPAGADKTPRRIIIDGIVRRFQRSLGIVSIVAMGAAVVITPTPLMIGLLIGNIALYAIFSRIAIPTQPKSWGVVYDDTSGRPLQNAVARIFETKYNKLLETQVTDIRGRYAFLVGANVYYVTFEKPGYEKEKKGPVDMLHPERQTDKAQVVAVDVRLRPRGVSKQTVTPPVPLPVKSPESRSPSQIEEKAEQKAPQPGEENLPEP